MGAEKPGLDELRSALENYRRHVATGERGSRNQRDHRCPGTQAVARGRCFARTRDQVRIARSPG